MSAADAIERAMGTEEVSVTQLMSTLRSAGSRASRKLVEGALASDDRFVCDTSTGRPRWSVAVGSRRAVSTIEPDPPRAPAPAGPLDGIELRDWQARAFAAWAANGCRGVVEAVTGSGKTRLAVAAVRVVTHRGGKALVLAPTIELLDQWTRELRDHASHLRVGRLGGGHADDLHSHDVLVATPHSASAVPVDLPAGAMGLLVADEAHRLGAPVWAAALTEQFEWRLALTATFERNDDALETVLGPYFGPVVTTYGFVDAAADGVIAPFRVALVGTGLEPSERESYEQADRRVRQHRKTLLELGMPRHPLELIAAASKVVAMAKPGGGYDRKLDAARGLLSAMRSRRDVGAQAAGKLTVLAQLAPQLAGQRSLVFTDTVEQAEQAAKVLRRAGVGAEEVHGQLDDKRRRIRMAQFRNGNLECVVAPRCLDEGVDVPEASIAVVLASFRSRRQMVQRLGRVLRVKDDGSEARLVVAFATGTREDPDSGAHEDFLEDVVPVAREVVTFDSDRSPEAAPAWLSAPSHPH